MYRNKDQLIRGMLLLLPAMIIIGTFQIYPSIKVFDMSFYTEYNYLKHIVYERGLENYTSLFNDSEFIVALKNTFTIVLVVVPISIILSLFFSLLLQRNTKFNNFMRSLYFLPFVTSTVAISVVWRWIFHSKYGLLNWFLYLAGVDSVNWLTDPQKAIYALIILCVWKTLGYNILIMVTGLRNIDEKYYQAAKVDGANNLDIIGKITLPLLSPTLFFVSTTALIGAFKVFSEVYALFEKTPGPLKSCLTMVYYIYDKLRNKYSYGMASAASVVLFVIIILITALQYLISKQTFALRGGDRE